MADGTVLFADFSHCCGKIQACGAGGVAENARNSAIFFTQEALREAARALPLLTVCKSHKGGTVPSPLFNFLFLAALIVPAAMYITGVIILMLSLVVKHYRLAHAPAHPLEALAH